MHIHLQRFKHLIVGYYGRLHRFENGRYKYKTSPAKTYSMILLGAAFLHKCYLEMYFSELDRDILRYVQGKANGEDITMNAVVADYLATRFESQCTGIHIIPKNLTALEQVTSKWNHQGLC